MAATMVGIDTARLAYEWTDVHVISAERAFQGAQQTIAVFRVAGQFGRGYGDKRSWRDMLGREQLAQGCGDLSDRGIFVVLQLGGIWTGVNFDWRALEVFDELVGGAAAITLAGVEVPEKQAPVFRTQEVVLVAVGLVDPGESVR